MERALGIDPPNVYVRRAIELAAWVWSGIGIASQPASASGEQDLRAYQG